MINEVEVKEPADSLVEFKHSKADGEGKEEMDYLDDDETFDSKVDSGYEGPTHDPDCIVRQYTTVPLRLLLLLLFLLLLRPRKRAYNETDDRGIRLG